MELSQNSNKTQRFKNLLNNLKGITNLGTQNRQVVTEYHLVLTLTCIQRHFTMC